MRIIAIACLIWCATQIDPIVCPASDGCPSCGARSANHYGLVYPPPITAASKFICRVSVPQGRGVSHSGSGVLLQGTPVYVLTAAHVVSGSRSRVFCAFGGKSYPGTIAAVRRQPDVALIRLDARPAGLDGVPMAEAGPASGEHCYAAGLGSNGTLRYQVGIRCDKNLSRPEWFEVSGQARLGDSGGPIFAVRRGAARIVGVLWGTGRNPTPPCHRIIGARLSAVKLLFRKRNAGNVPRPPISRPRVSPVGQRPVAQPGAC